MTGYTAQYNSIFELHYLRIKITISNVVMYTVKLNGNCDIIHGLFYLDITAYMSVF